MEEADLHCEGGAGRYLYEFFAIAVAVACI
jgi:hypothetical protein